MAAAALAVGANICTVISLFVELSHHRIVSKFGGQERSISAADKQKLLLEVATAEQMLDKVNYEQLLEYPLLFRCLKDGIYHAEDMLEEFSIADNQVVDHLLSIGSVTDVQTMLESANEKMCEYFGLPSCESKDLVYQVKSLLPSSSNSDDREKHLRDLWPGYRHLQKCFLLASIFPKSYKFEKDNLIQLWMAQGFIRNDGGIKGSLEDIGSSYLRELEKRNVFSNSGGCYQIRDELHELANFVSLGECLTINDDEAITDFLSCITSSLRHFSLLRKSLERVKHVHEDLAIFEENIKGKCEGLRTFLLHIEGEKGIYQFCFKRLAFCKLLRVLDISCSSITTVTDSISCLKNLRYLNLSKSRIEELPSTICELKRLWILKLNGCKELRDLHYLGKLVNLRHLLLDKNHHLDSLPPGIGQLTELETFSCPFVVGIGDGKNLEVLRNMNNLRGSLCISYLETLVSLDEAGEAALNEKQFLQRLKFKWNEYRNFQVLAKLKPHENLKILKLSGYGGVGFPDWMANPSSFLPNLTKVSLSKCNGCETLPEFWRLKSLKSLSLSISGTDLAKTLNIDFGDTGFISLEILQLKNMPDLTCWIVEQAGSIGMCPFPKLSQLIFKDCPKLVDLKVLHKHGDDDWLPFPKLNQLTFQECPDLRGLDFLQCLNSDCRLKIKESPLTEWMGRDRDWQTEEQEDGSFIYSRLKSRFEEQPSEENDVWCMFKSLILWNQ